MVHNWFRGCIFNSTAGRRKFLSVLIAGYLCADCEARLREWCVSDRALDSIGHLLSYVRDFAIRKPRSIPTSVFIGHGRRKDWQKVRDHLTKTHGLHVDEFNVSPSAGVTTVERLAQMLGSACFAILVMTAEDWERGGKRKARQNVVHEIGLFQGRLGFQRAIILKEKGAEEFSNIKGLTYISFKKAKIAEAFAEIDRALVRERVIAAPNPTAK
jgi:predicted nucleotide-binding protein